MQTTVANKNSQKPRSFVEINGKRYAVRGNTVAAAASSPRMGQDVMAPTATATAEKKPAHPKSKPAERKVMDIRPVKHVKHHRPQHAQTLMRRSVTKPAPIKRLKAVTRTDILAKAPSGVTVVPKISFHQTDPRLKARAARINQSELIHRFSPSVFVAEPVSTPSPEEQAAIKIAQQTSPQHSMDIFERALARADAHTEKPVHPKKAKRAHKSATKRRHRTPTLVTMSLAVMLLTAFFAYQNKTALTMHYASAKAGFHASLPAYKPSGFSVGRFTYSTGSVSTAFSNHTSNQNFTLTQTATTDGRSQLQKVVASAGSQYQAVQHNGQTIYIYGNNNAAWFKSGIFYNLDSNASLSTSQIIDLATSI